LSVVRESRQEDPVRKILITALLAVFVSVRGMSDVIVLEEPTIYPDTETNREFIEKSLVEAAYYVEKVYEGRVILTGGWLGTAGYVSENFSHGIGRTGRGDADYTLRVNAVNDGESRVISLSLIRNSDEKEADPVSFFGPWGPGMGADLGRSVFYLWGAIEDFSAFEGSEPPVYVDEFAAGAIPAARLPVQGVQIYPYSLAMGREGNLLVGGNSLALEMDRYFRILSFPGKSLVEQGNYSYAFAVDTTPGGTVFFMPSTGGEIYSFVPGAERPRRIRTAVSGAAGLAVLPDGSPFVVDSNGKRAILFKDRERKEFDIFPTEYSYITAVTAGPSGNIWVKDTMDRHIRIYSPEGILVDSLIPLADSNELTGTRGIAVFQNGDFLLLSPQGLSRFKRNGEPVWSLDAIPSPEGGGFTTVMDVAVDSGTGLIYLSDYTGRRIIKLLDRGYALARKADVRFENELIRINRTLEDDPYDAEALGRKGGLYEENGAPEAAMAVWERVLESDPFDSRAERRLARLELEILRDGARRLKDTTLELLLTLGPESARDKYSETVKLYEQILYRAPDDAKSTEELADLKRQFELYQSPAAPRVPPLEIASVDIDRLFPSLIQYYTRNPAGTIKVVNPGNEPAKKLRAEVFIKNFMDFPSAGEVESIPPGGEAVIELPVRFNREVFALEEDLPVQVGIILSYSMEGERYEITSSAGTTLYRRTALSWDESAKLAAFVTPNEEVVSRFSHRVASAVTSREEIWNRYRLSGEFLRGIALFDGVGTYGIEYIEDPASPISSVLENSRVVDTVRFPRTTLYYRSGDCDDSTALLCSLFESAGIATAVMTSPGHVFFAYDTGEPASNRWQFEDDDLAVIEYEGTLWVPLEATVVNRGFYTAWKSASALYTRYSGTGEIEFLPVREGWSVYPSLPLPESPFTVVEPPSVRIADAVEVSLGTMRTELYERVARRLRSELISSSGRNRNRKLNMLGILHARFGDFGKAESRFAEALESDSQSLSAYINMANLKLLEGNVDEAVRFLRRGRAVRPDSVMIDLLLAKAYHRGGDRIRAGEHYDAVAEKSPELAESITYIGSEGAAGTRASGAGESEGVFWNIEE
jgi:tetratricopeptide (TPR) repeat protein